MKTEYFPFAITNQFADTDIAYAEQDPNLANFFKYAPKLEEFARVIEDKSKDPIDRKLLQSVLRDQYQNYSTDITQAKAQIDLLDKETTFTVTTAHQPCLFTGPLFFIYKVISAVKLASQLKERYPENDILPVLVLGGEDHDFEEMNHAYVFGRRIEWANDETGSVGRMSTASLKDVLLELKEVLGSSPQAISIYEPLEACFKAHTRYDVALADWINHLLGHLGFIIVRMDDDRLKRKAIDLFREELTNQPSAELVQKVQGQMEASGIKPQAFVREINLFYLTSNQRERIVLENGHYSILNTDLNFSPSELIEHLQSHPDRFSPNVVMRPIYQEAILPNLAYIGGGGELAYWLERKTQFEHFGVNFPVLVRRDSFLWIDRGTNKKIGKLDIPLELFFLRQDRIVSRYLKAHAENEFQLKQEKTRVEKIFEDIAGKAKDIDPTLVRTVEAEGKNVIKGIEHLESKLRKAEKQRHEVAIKQIESVVDKILPEGKPQERHTNFLTFYSRMGNDFFDAIFDRADPLDMRLKVILEE